MRQVMGLLITIASFIFIAIFCRLIFEEANAIEQKKDTITNIVDLTTTDPIKPVTLIDRNGKVFSEEYIEWRQPIDLESIPSIAKQLFIYSEDESFYEHLGFDVSAITRAFIVNSNENSIQQGASTITQQLVRMRYLSNEKTYERKIMELFYAYELEQAYTKDAILEMYLNEAYFANKVYGIQSASTYYFNKSIDQLNTAEIAFIAAIPNNPTLYDPTRHFDHTKKRQERLLTMLEAQHVISKDELQQLIDTPIKLSIKQKKQKYPAYTTYVLNELKQLIAAEHSSTNTLSDDEVDEIYAELMNSGITIYTALDPQKQSIDTQNINAIMDVYDFQASATVIDNDTREVISVYPGKNYKKYDLNRSYQAYRQPGSSFKPIADYAPFLNETGYSTNYIVSSSAFCIGNYCPSNYGNYYGGDVTLTNAMKNSYNTSALRIVNAIGLDKSFEYVNQFHFSKINEDNYTYAASLGGLKYGVTTSELASAYTSFIDGSYIDSVSIRKVEDADGNTIYDWANKSSQIWNAKTVDAMRSMLSEVAISGTAANVQKNGGYLGVKTGTTNTFNDLWIAGLNDRYTTAVWIGYDSPSSLEQYERQQVHFKIFNAIMNN